MPKWFDITRSDKFQALPQEEQVAVKQRFFERFMLPELDKDEDLKAPDVKQAIFQKFMSSPDDTGQGYVTSMLGAAGRGFGEMLPGAVEGFGALTNNEAIRGAGQDLRSGLESIAPVNPIYAESIPVKLSNVGGQAMSVLATAGAGGAVGKALGGVGAVGKGAQTAALGSAFLQGAAEGRREAEQYGMEGPEAYMRTLAGGAIEAGTEFLPFGMASETALAKRMFAGAPRTTSFTGAALSEGGEEGLGKMASNLATQGLAPIGVETPGITEGALEATAYGTFGGSLIGGVNALIPTAPKDQTPEQKQWQAEINATPVQEAPQVTPEESAKNAEQGGTPVVTPDGQVTWLPAMSEALRPTQQAAVEQPSDVEQRLEETMRNPALEIAKEVGEAATENLANTGNNQSAAANKNFFNVADQILQTQVSEPPVQPSEEAEAPVAEEALGVTPEEESLAAQRRADLLSAAADAAKGKTKAQVSPVVTAMVTPQQPTPQENAPREIPLKESLRQKPQDGVEGREAEEASIGDQLRGAAEGEEEVGLPPRVREQAKDVYNSIAPTRAGQALTQAAEGVVVGMPSPVDELYDNARLESSRWPSFVEESKKAADKLYSSYAGVRDALRKQFGPTIRLFRYQGSGEEAQTFVGSKKTLNWASTEAEARQYKGENRVLRVEEIPIEDIVAVNVGPKGDYEEFVVFNREANPDFPPSYKTAKKPTPATVGKVMPGGVATERDIETGAPRLDPKNDYFASNLASRAWRIAAGMRWDDNASDWIHPDYPSRSRSVVEAEITESNPPQKTDVQRVFNELAKSYGREDLIKGEKTEKQDAQDFIQVGRFVKVGYRVPVYEKGEVVGGKTNKVVGKITRIMPDGKVEVRLNQGGFKVLPPSEIEDAPTHVGNKPLSPQTTAAKSLVNQLNEAKSRQEAQAILESATAQQVKEAAQEMGYPATGSKKAVVSRLVAAVGSRADAKAIRQQSPQTTQAAAETQTSGVATERDLTKPEEQPAVKAPPEGKKSLYQIRAAKGRPATDVDGIPTGWKLNEFRDAVELVSEDASKYVVFSIENPSSYGDKMRALIMAENWAIDNPVRAQIEAAPMQANYGAGRVEDVTLKTVKFVHTTKTKPGKGQKTGYYPGTYAYESESGLLPSMEGKKFVGELPESNIYTLKDADQLKKDAADAGFGRHSGNGNAEVKYLQSLGFKAMRRPSMGGTEIIVFDTKDANFQPQPTAAETQTPESLRVDSGAAGFVQSEPVEGSIPTDEKESAKTAIESTEKSLEQPGYGAKLNAIRKSIRELGPDSQKAQTQALNDLMAMPLADLQAAFEVVTGIPTKLANKRQLANNILNEMLAESRNEKLPEADETFRKAEIEAEEEIQRQNAQSLARIFNDKLRTNPVKGLVSSGDVERAIGQLQNSGEVPGAIFTWRGTAKELQRLAKTPAFKRAFPGTAQAAEQGNVEGIYENGMAFVITDQVVVTDLDRARAASEGTTPEVAAAKRVIAHENYHKGVALLSPKDQAQLVSLLRKLFPAAELDDLAKSYKQYADWRTNRASEYALLEEKMQKAIEEMKEVPRDGLLRELVDFLKAIWRKWTGQPKGEPKLRDLKDVVRLLRSTLKDAHKAQANRTANGGRVMMSLPAFRNFVPAVNLNGRIETGASHYEAWLKHAIRQIPSYKKDGLSDSEVKDLADKWLVDHPEAMANSMTKEGFVTDEGYLNRQDSLKKFLALGGKQRLDPGEVRDWLDSADVESARMSLGTNLIDAEYLEAVANGDMEKAQRMVDEAAGLAGYVSAVKHGTHNDFSIFDTSKGRDQGNRFEMNNWGIWTTDDDASIYGPKVLKLYGKSSSPLRVQNFEEWFDDYVKHAYPLFYFKGITADELAESLRDEAGAYFKRKKDIPLGIVRTKEYRQMLADQPGATGYVKSLKERGFDSVLMEGGFLDGQLQTVRIYLDSNQLKSADPVTYDDAGNVIPLSQRFQPTSPDIRFSLSPVQYSSENDEIQSSAQQTSRSMDYTPRQLEVHFAVRKAYDAMPMDNGVAVPLFELFDKTKEFVPDLNAQEFSQIVQGLYDDNAALLNTGAMSSEKPSPGGLSEAGLNPKEIIDRIGAAIENLREFSEDEGLPLGLRWLQTYYPGSPTDFSVGDIMPESYEWDDGESTGISLGGTAVFDANKPERVVKYANGFQLAKRYSDLNFAIVIGEDIGSGGMPEPGARVFRNARILQILRFPKDPESSRAAAGTFQFPILNRDNEPASSVVILPGKGMASYAGEKAIENLPEERRQFMRDSLETAKAMAAAGKDREEIRAVTGWFPNPYDGKMRWELPDDDVTVDLSKFTRLVDGGEDVRLTVGQWLLDKHETQKESFVTRTRGASRDVLIGESRRIQKEQNDNSERLRAFYAGEGNPNRLNGRVPLSFIMDNDALFGAYPELAWLPVSVNSRDIDNPLSKGAYSRDGLIFLNPVNPDSETLRDTTDEEAASILLHEIQHWIQNNEGFAVGGNAEAMRKMNDFIGLAVNQSKLAKVLRDAADLQDSVGGFTNAVVANLPQDKIDIAFGAYHSSEDRWMPSEELRKEADKLDKKILDTDFTGYEAYRRLAGEIEARDVQARQKLTPEQRAATAPYSSENIAPEDAIVMFGGSGPQMSLGRPLSPEKYARHAELEAKHNAGTITPEETKEAEKLVEKAARRAGYNVGPVWHLSQEDFNEFSPEFRSQFGTVGPGFYFSGKPSKYLAKKRPVQRKFFLKISKPLPLDKEGMPKRTFMEMLGRTMDAAVEKKMEGGVSDGIINSRMMEGTYDGIYTVWNSEQIKSADPFTGVPLEQRFDVTSPDIRFSYGAADSSAAATYRNEVDVISKGLPVGREYQGAPMKGMTVEDHATFNQNAMGDAAERLLKSLSKDHSMEEIFELLQQPDFQRELGLFDPTMVKSDAAKLTYLKLVAQFKQRAWNASNKAKTEGQRIKANVLYRQVSQYYANLTTGGGQFLQSIQQIHEDPRSRFAFDIERAENKMAKANAEAVENQSGPEGMNPVKANVDSMVNGSGESATEDVLEEVEEDQDAIDLAEGEATLEGEDKTLWEKVKDWLREIGAATRQLRAFDRGGKASLSSEQRNAIAGMSKEELVALIADRKKKVNAALKKLLGEESEAKTPEQKAKRKKRGGMIDAAQKRVESGKDVDPKPSSDPTMRDVLREINKARREIKGANEKPIQWAEILRQSPKSTEKAIGTEEYRKRIFDAMMASDAFKGMSDQQKGRLSDLFSEAWEKKRTAILDKMLDTYSENLDHQKEKRKLAKALKDSRNQLLELVNLGAYNNDELVRAIGERFGLKTEFTAEEKAKLNELADKLQDDTLNRAKRNKLAREYLSLLESATGIPASELLSMVWVTSVLNGGGTIFSIATSFLNGFYVIMGNHAARAWTELARGNYKEAVDIMLDTFKAMSKWLQSYAPSAERAWNYLWTGDVSLLEAAANDPFKNVKTLGDIQRHQANAERLAKDPKLVKQYIGRYLRFWGRLLTALDAFNVMTNKAGAMALAMRQSGLTSEQIKEIDAAHDMAVFKKRIIETDPFFKGQKPTDSFGRAYLHSLAEAEMYASLAKMGVQVENADFMASESAYTMNPTGVGGIFYNFVKGVDTKATNFTKDFMKRAEGHWAKEKNWDTGWEMFLAHLAQFLSYQVVNAFGLRFARFAGNKFNQGLSFIPGVGLLRRRELSNENLKGREQAFIDSIRRNQIAGLLLGVAGVTLLRSIVDEPDDEKRGWAINGGFNNLTPDQKRQKLARGEKEYTIRIGNLVWNYQNWPISQPLAAVGAMSDMIRFSPDKWKEKGLGDKLMSGALSGLKATLEIPALTQVGELLGTGVSSKDPTEQTQNRLVRALAGWSGGFMPRFLKDIDYMAEPTMRKYETFWQKTSSHIPVYRRYTGKDFYDILGNPVEKNAIPGSREFAKLDERPEYQILGALNSRGIWLTPANAEYRMIGKGRNRRRLTQEEADKYSLESGKEYRKMLIRYGARALRMPPEKAKNYISDLADKARDRALDRVARR